MRWKKRYEDISEKKFFEYIDRMPERHEEKLDLATLEKWVAEDEERCRLRTRICRIIKRR